MENMICNSDYDDIGRVLISEKEIDEIITRLSAEIDSYMEKNGKGKNLLLICVLKGSMPFAAELMKKIKTPLRIDFIKASSYGSGVVSSGKLNISLDVSEHDWKNTVAVIIEDIIDSGNTLKKLLAHIREKGASDVKICTLLDKPSRREVEIESDFVGAVIPNEFVVGFGLDADERYRQLPFVGILKEEVISKFIV